MSPSATPATQSDSPCHQVPRLPHKVTRRHRRQSRPSASPSAVSATLATQSDKAQFAACSPVKEKALHSLFSTDICTNFHAGQIKAHVEILGTATATKKQRKALPLETKRMTQASDFIAKVGFLPISRSSKYETIRLAGYPKATYGWIARFPTKKETFDFDSKVFEATREPCLGGRHHKRLLLTVGFDLHVGLRHVGRMLSKQKREASLQINVPAEPRFSEKQAHKWLQKCGWQQVHATAWKHDSLRLQINTDMDKKWVSHNLREAWRQEEWNALTHQNSRHQTQDIKDEPYMSSLCDLVRKIVKSSFGPLRWLLLGAGISPEHHRKKLE